DRRLRGIGQPPRTRVEAAEWLRRLGDVAPDECESAVRAFLLELQQEGVVAPMPIHGSERWILAEDAERYRMAFASDAREGQAAQTAAAVILHRFLDTHALVGLEDVLQRYPFERTWAQRQIEEWTRSGRLVQVVASAAAPLQWSAPANFEQMQRGTLSILRREVMTCPAAQYVDFLLHWQHVHPTTQLTEATGLQEVMRQLQNVSLPVELWEQAVLPLRCRGYQPRHLDELVAAGRWTWHCRRDGEDGVGSVAFVERESLGHLQPPIVEASGLGAVDSALLDVLRNRGASFTAELATASNLPVAAVRRSLWSLLSLGLATNDRFEVLRKGEPPGDEAPPMRSRGELRAFLRDTRRHREQDWPEGRWSLLAWGQPDPEAAAIFQARLLLERFGIVTRELAVMSGTSVPWRILYEILSRMELSGDVRRGYFVEGLSGAQFALPEAAKQLHDLALPSSVQAPALLLHSLDPANLYGSGAALDVPFLSDQPRTFARRSGNWLVVKAGRPLLLIEQYGKRLTAPPQAMREELTQATARLPELLKLTPTRDVRHRLTVETWNEEPVTATVGRDLLEQAGFVRDYQAMTLYAVWSS
ncbi:MAG: hypothetical protein HY289_07525, partial [Planctomycetes bacterium]|nr:hypothetical protein [Planctomycetota bacterium]